MSRPGWENAINVARNAEPHGPTAYRIAVTETLSRTIEVTAESVDEAIEAAQDLYYDGKVELNAEDYCGTEFEFVEMREPSEN